LDVGQTILAWGLGIFLLAALVRLLRAPLRMAARLVFNTLLGFGALALVRSTAAYTGITLGLNFFNAALIGLLGVPGFVLLLLTQWVLG
jgi:inhibitor of the pro-sigma K processing machinery